MFVSIGVDEMIELEENKKVLDNLENRIKSIGESL